VRTRRSPEGIEPVSDILTAEQIRSVRNWKSYRDGVGEHPVMELSPQQRDLLCDSHEALRATVARLEHDNEALLMAAQLGYDLSTYAAVVALDEHADMTDAYRADLIALIEQVQDECNHIESISKKSGTIMVDDRHVERLKASIRDPQEPRT
jgi:hypothetical protein